MSHENNHQQAQMLRGTAWLTASNFISRLLGAVYIIPWYIWMGTYAAKANGLFTMGYNIYAWFLLVSTAGIPVAVAKQVAKYNTMREEEHSFALIRSFLGFMTELGLVFALVLYVFAPWLADLSGVGKDLILIMQSLAWGVLIFPSMSVIRGFFQGMNNLKPYAMSQIAEQVIRVIWMLLATFIIMKLGSGDYLAAVTQSTFAAFVGMVASFAVLIYFLAQEGSLKRVFETGDKINSKRLLVDTIKEAIPFILTGSAIQLFQILDQLTFINSMSWFTNYSNEDLVVMFSYFSANPNKITMILISVGVSIGSVGLPLLTENYIKGDLKAASRLVQDSLTLLFMFLLPATVGVVMVGEPLYTVFYGKPDSLAMGLFVFTVLQSIILGLYMVLSPMLQAMFRNRKAVLYFIYGSIAKLVLQLPTIALFHSYGPLISTTIALIIPNVLMYRDICKVTGVKRKVILKRTILISLLTLVMFLLIGTIQWLLGFFFQPSGRLWSFFYVALVGAMGGGLYMVMSLRTYLLDKVIGKAQADRLRAKFKLS
ncbi:putative polysaccharide biosynthesis protein [Streptococcus pneumoniae]|uniref:putative polysaccharide biosynthesis protein n=1 Tax=Streptococcus pneumoniae TaxID=1313 RepID=UPI0005DAFFFF|nr:polysaccharide biosynthesis protein [Streptococcus pneumoniae]CEV60519.1 polysaccharide biosynthesis protein [Streptococcus pneumoniae]CIN75015.1 polysaccharide biosynthesis protein [Streptococcus pneumoniae]CIO82887.1 polysaccharide biosynthesis protein [Streptococcus pneumoniae]CIQ54615.1 polysaccharide biosynthesis protein [Streptococcus pneumoniae]CIR00168.1 polysaccharide biosynthesis protein [Streptococcus pneumoniae]